MINFVASSGLLPTGQCLSRVGITQTRSVALPYKGRQYFHWCLNITFNSLNSYLKTHREQQKKTAWLCLPMDSARQTCRAWRPAVGLANMPQLPFTKTDTHTWSWKTFTEHMFCKCAFFQALLPRSLYSNAIYRHCSYRRITSFLK